MPYTIDGIKTKAIPIVIRYGKDALRLLDSYARAMRMKKTEFLEEIGRDEVKLYESNSR